MDMLSLKKHFNNSMTIWRRTSAKQDEFGGVVNDFEKLDWGVPCRVFEVSGPAFRLNWQGNEYMADQRLMCDKEVDIQVGDRIKEELGGQNYMVIRFSYIQRGATVSHIECLLTRIEANDAT